MRVNEWQVTLGKFLKSQISVASRVRENNADMMYHID